MFAGLAMAVLPSVINAVSSSQSQDAANSRNEAQIAANASTNASSIELANTSYQRAVADLRLAGLNPMLAYQKGGGAATPNLQAPQIEDVMKNSVTNGVAAASAVTSQMVAKAQIENLAADTRLKQSGAVKADEESNVARTQAALNAVGVDKMNSEIGVNNAQTSLNRANEALVLESVKKIAPEIRVMVSQANLNDAQKQKLVAELPLIAAQTQRTHAETDVAYEERLLKKVDVTIKALGYNKAVNESNMNDSSFGRALPYVSNATEAAGRISPWAFLFSK